MHGTSNRICSEIYKYTRMSRRNFGAATPQMGVSRSKWLGNERRWFLVRSPSTNAVQSRCGTLHASRIFPVAQGAGTSTRPQNPVSILKWTWPSQSLELHEARRRSPPLRVPAGKGTSEQRAPERAFVISMCNRDRQFRPSRQRPRRVSQSLDFQYRPAPRTHAENPPGRPKRKARRAA